MPVEKENRADYIKARDIDLNTLSAVSSQIETLEGVYCVVTGSYAIEALVERPLNHEDMDVNVFTLSPLADISRVASLLERLSVPGLKFQLFKQTDDRLEYDVLPEQANSRRLEMQFVEAKYVERSTVDFRLSSGGIVPTVILPLIDSKGQEYSFRVKSLPYSIATWIIRISGTVENPKREIKESDLGHLRLLLSGSYKEEDVFLAMGNHPQMPANMSESEVFNRAMERIKV